MYELTLTSNERRAIDWVGNRYFNGDSLYRLLWAECNQTVPEGADWDHEGDITFYLPENIAWQISDICDADHGLWPCFSKELVGKMDDFLARVV